MQLKRISTPGDFPNLAVYEWPGSEGKALNIIFDNREFEQGWQGLVRVWLFLALWISLFVVTFMYPEFFGSFLLLWVFACVVLLVWLYKTKVKLPWTVKRRIELDTGAEALRVYRNGALEVQRPLDGLVNLTVDEHPEAVIKREERMAKKEKHLSFEERTHCLFGWFGAKGAEKVLLVKRAEWPCHHSLFEVRQAILWSYDRLGAAARQQDQPYQPAGNEAPSPGGMNPPLD